MKRRLRLAKYDHNGEPLFDTDVLSPEELAADWYGIPTGERPVEFDPTLVATIVALQNGDGAA